MNYEQLNKLTVPKLKNILKLNKIKGYSKMNKKELIIYIINSIYKYNNNNIDNNIDNNLIQKLINIFTEIFNTIYTCKSNFENHIKNIFDANKLVSIKKHNIDYVKYDIAYCYQPNGTQCSPDFYVYINGVNTPIPI